MKLNANLLVQNSEELYKYNEAYIGSRIKQTDEWVNVFSFLLFQWHNIQFIPWFYDI